MTNSNYTVKPGKRHKKSPPGNQFPTDLNIFHHQPTGLDIRDIDRHAHQLHETGHDTLATADAAGNSDSNSCHNPMYLPVLSENLPARG